MLRALTGEDDDGLDPVSDDMKALALFEQPANAVTDDGEWVILTLVNVWSSRFGRRGLVDPSGGVKFAPAQNTVVLIAIPLVDEPENKHPEGTITFDQWQRVQNMIAVAVQKSFVPESQNDF
jgi:hypothetical protein